MEDILRKYNFIEKMVKGKTEYYIEFKDGEKNSNCIPVSSELYMEMKKLMRSERNMIRSDERHLEQLELSDETLHYRATHKGIDTESQVLWNLQVEELREAIEELPQVQKRRFILHCEMQFTLEQIAVNEGCSKQTVKKSVDVAKKKIRNRMKYFVG